MIKLTSLVLVLYAAYAGFVYGASEEQVVEHGAGAQALQQSWAWDATFARADRHVKALHEKITQSSIAQKMPLITSISSRLPSDFSLYDDIACGACCAGIAYRYPAQTKSYVTWTNVVYGTSLIYFANKLFPDWLKDCVRKIPFFGKLIDEYRYGRYKVVFRGSQADRDPIFPEPSPSFAIAEYALGVGIVWGLRDYLSFENVAKAAIVCHLLSFFSPKCMIIKVPIVRRLLR